MEKNKLLKNKNLIDGIILFILSTFFINQSIKLHGNNQWALSPALFPLIITSFLLLFSIGLIIKGIKYGNINEDKKISKSNKISLLKIILISFIYLFLLDKLHFLISSILYLLVFMYILGERDIKILLAISVITPILIQYIFGTILNVYLP